MLTSKARRRLAVKTSALAVLGAGVFVGVPALASSMAPKPVTYMCKNVLNAAAQATEVKFQMDLAGPLTAVSPSATAVVTWKMTQPSPSLPAPSAIAATDRVVVDADVVVTGTPNPLPTETRTVGASSTPGAVASGAPMPLPTILVSLTPTARGTMAVIPQDFALLVGPTSATGSELDWYTCDIAPGKEAEATAAAALITVATGTPTSTNTSTGTATPTPTSTPTTTTPKPTKTTTKFVTETPQDNGGKVTKTPKAGADTGGGGDMGPDGRMFILTGSLLILAAGAGGLMIRRRGLNRG
ncbi:hypothetical protein [Nonomuraea endophytica]|uniref:hypothetical protein n=1 Tax=Nonomuraea endophytica TaxID=714136 RepID=UPI0037CAE686